MSKHPRVLKEVNRALDGWPRGEPFTTDDIYQLCCKQTSMRTVSMYITRYPGISSVKGPDNRLIWTISE